MHIKYAYMHIYMPRYILSPAVSLFSSWVRELRSRYQSRDSRAIIYFSVEKTVPVHKKDAPEGANKIPLLEAYVTVVHTGLRFAK